MSAGTIRACAMSSTGFTRVIVEKPFGHDYQSAHALAHALGDIFDEGSIYRIDHYLGKEMVQVSVVRRGDRCKKAGRRGVVRYAAVWCGGVPCDARSGHSVVFSAETCYVVWYCVVGSVTRSADLEVWCGVQFQPTTTRCRYVWVCVGLCLQNIIVLRFSNVMFSRFWDRDSISSVQITFKVGAQMRACVGVLLCVSFLAESYTTTHQRTLPPALA